jgi:hypothetical protein
VRRIKIGDRGFGLLYAMIGERGDLLRIGTYEELERWYIARKGQGVWC